VTVRLTRAQRELLGFFGGQRGPPWQRRSCVYAALQRLGLIEREPDSSCYRITERGRQVLAPTEIRGGEGMT
jgi:hypothetical protein